MAHFIGKVTGSAKTEAYRLGSKNSGIEASAQGWNIGGKVILSRNSTDRGDDTYLYLTAGSNARFRSIPIVSAIHDDTTGDISITVFSPKNGETLEVCKIEME